MKTIKEWFHELPQPYRLQALENYSLNYRPNVDRCSTMSQALISGFQWALTSQGGEYWAAVHQKYGKDAHIHLKAATVTQKVVVVIDGRIRFYNDILI